MVEILDTTTTLLHENLKGLVRGACKYPRAQQNVNFFAIESNFNKYMKYTSSVIRMIGNKMTSILPYTHETNDIWVNDSPYNEQTLIYKHS